MVADAGDKLSQEAKEPVESAIAALKTANEGSDVEAINAAIEQLNTAQHKAAEELYKQPEGSDAPQPGGDPEGGAGTDPSAGGESASDDVIDAEVVGGRQEVARTDSAMDFYLILGLDREASSREVQRAYTRLARRYHPDINPGDHEAEAVYRQATEAFETLSDPDRRQTYDAHGRRTQPTVGGSVEFHGFDFSAPVSGGVGDLRRALRR